MWKELSSDNLNYLSGKLLSWHKNPGLLNFISVIWMKYGLPSILWKMSWFLHVSIFSVYISTPTKPSSTRVGLLEFSNTMINCQKTFLMNSGPMQQTVAKDKAWTSAASQTFQQEYFRIWFSKFTIMSTNDPKVGSVINYMYIDGYWH